MACIEPFGQSRSPSFFASLAQVEALRSGGFCCPRLLRYAMASSDFPRGFARHFGLRLIGPLTAAEFPPTAWDLVRFLTLPSVHAVARNAEGDGGFPSLCIHRRCGLRRYTGGSTTLFSDSPSDNRPKCHDGAMPSLVVRPERWPVPPDWVLRLTCRVCFDVTGYPVTPDPRLPGS